LRQTLGVVRNGDAGVLLHCGGAPRGMREWGGRYYTLTAEQVRPTPEMGAALDTDYLIGLGAVEQRMLILVDIEKLMSSVEIGLIEKLAA